MPRMKAARMRICQATISILSIALHCTVALSKGGDEPSDKYFVALANNSTTQLNSNLTQRQQDAMELIFNLRITNRIPKKVLTDPLEALALSLQRNIPLRPVGGGHGYLGNAIVPGGIALDMGSKNGVYVHPDADLVTIQSGAVFADFYLATVNSTGGFSGMLPTGNCPTVGVAGYTLGGGYGHGSRFYGVLADNIVSMRVLTVDPTTNEITERVLSKNSSGEDADLFWAIRGPGGARFGVVQEFTFQLRPVPDDMFIYEMRFRSDLTKEERVAAIRTWLSWAETVKYNTDLSSQMAYGRGYHHLAGLSTNRNAIESTESSLYEILKPYLDVSLSRPHIPYTLDNVVQVFKGCSSLAECLAAPKTAFLARSSYLSIPHTLSQLEAIVDVITRRSEFPTYGGIELTLWHLQGGVDTDNAFTLRDYDLLSQIYVSGDAENEQSPWPAAMFGALTGGLTVNSVAFPAYPNYLDATIKDAETGFPLEFHLSPEKVARLESIARRYKNIFSWTSPTTEAPPPAPTSAIVYVGSGFYSQPSAIHSFRLDLASGQLAPSGAPTLETPDSPTFIVANPSNNIVYASIEGNAPGQVVAATIIDPVDGALATLNRASTGGTGSPHISMDRTGTYLFLSHYTSGDVTVVEVRDDGRVGPVVESVSLGAGALPHGVWVSPCNAFAFAVLKGANGIYQFHFNDSSGELIPNKRQEFVASREGAGPRHLAFHPSQPWAYVINELGSTVTHYAYNATGGTLEPIGQDVSTVPRMEEGVANTGAEIVVAPSGEYVYASNRGHNSIAIFVVDASDGSLRRIGTQSTGGETPRVFAVDDAGRYLVVANQDTDSLAVFSIDAATGLLALTGDLVTVPTPSWVGVVHTQQA